MRTVANSLRVASTDLAIRSPASSMYSLRMSSSPPVATTVPTRSPHTIRSMLRSSSMLKTWIGSLLSMHSDSAVESITCSCCSIASRWVISGMNSASGSLRGSAV